MEVSVEALQQAIAIRRRIDALEKRLSAILAASAPRRTASTAKLISATKKGGLTPAGRRRLSQLMKARWAARRKAGLAKAKGRVTPSGRRRLSQLMKARWAARTKGARKKTSLWRRKGELTPAGRRRLSELMKARWAKKKRGRSDTNTTGPKYRP